SIYFLKFVWLVIHWANSCLLYQMAKRLKAESTYVVFIYAFNPLVVLELIINGHNDGLLLLFSQLAILLLEPHALAALLAAMSGVLVKVSGAALVLVVVVHLVRQRQWRVVGAAAALAAFS